MKEPIEQWKIFIKEWHSNPENKIAEMEWKVWKPGFYDFMNWLAERDK